MKNDLTNELEKFIDIVGDRNALQKKYLKTIMINLQEDEIESLVSLIGFYENRGYSISAIAETYLLFIQVVMEETKYFAEHGEYRHHSFAEVSEDVYFDHEYMTKYMIGLALSTYLLNFHLCSMRWFDSLIAGVTGNHYLEIGPGHGEYLYRAMRLAKMNSYTAVDLSPASIEMTKKYIEYRMPTHTEVNCEYLCKDFLDFDEKMKFDAIVMGEVLEHVEKPELFLQKISHIASQDAFIYVTTVINAPERDHIFLFHNYKEIEELVQTTGLHVSDYRLITHNNKTLEKVIQRREPILVAMMLKKD